MQQTTTGILITMKRTMVERAENLPALVYLAGLVLGFFFWTVLFSNLPPRTAPITSSQLTRQPDSSSNELDRSR